MNEQILFVDDDESIRESFALYLKTKGLVVATAKSAQEAIWMIEGSSKPNHIEDRTGSVYKP